jgi:hypothetical protein
MVQVLRNTTNVRYSILECTENISVAKMTGEKKKVLKTSQDSDVYGILSDVPGCRSNLLT